MKTTQNPSWQQTMLRVKDIQKTLDFYTTHFGLTVIDKIDFPEYTFSLHFLATVSEPYTLEPGTQAAHDFLWEYPGTTLELTYNYGTETNPDFKYDSGNNEPKRGFGHIAFNTDDVYAVSAELEGNGVAFRKRPDEGNMKGLAFALDPDGYWVEIVRRDPAHTIKDKFNLSQTMMRIKDPKLSIPFYTERLGMTVVSERHFDKGAFSLYFLATLQKGEVGPADPTSEEASLWVKRRMLPVLELTHNHGTESQEGPVYHNGNSEPKGFGHIGFLVDDLAGIVAEMDAAGVKFQKRPEEGKMHSLAFALDPDNYWIELIQRGWKM